MGLWATAHGQIALGIGGIGIRLGIAVALATATGWLSWRWLPGGHVDLCWDGQQWSIDGRAGTVELMIDTGSWMLLRQRVAGGGHWLAVGAGDAGAVWHGLRVALHAPPRALDTAAAEQGR